MTFKKQVIFLAVATRLHSGNNSTLYESLGFLTLLNFDSHTDDV